MYLYVDIHPGMTHESVSTFFQWDLLHCFFSKYVYGLLCWIAFPFDIEVGRGRDRMVVGLTNTYAISAYHH
jgi:hypothetical protein